MADPQLVSFVQEQRARGANEVQIYSQLKQAGWRDQDIAETMGKAVPTGEAKEMLSAISSSHFLKGEDSSTIAVIKDFAIYGAIGTLVGIIGGYFSGMVLGGEFAYALRTFPGASQFLKPHLNIGSDLLELAVSFIVYGFLGWIFSRYSQQLMDLVGKVYNMRRRSMFWILFWPQTIYTTISSIVGGFILVIAMPVFVIPVLINIIFSTIGDFIFALGASRSLKRNIGLEYWLSN